MMYLGNEMIGITSTPIVNDIDDTAGIGDYDKVFSADKIMKISMQDDIMETLQFEDIPGAVQSYTFNNGKISSVTHSSGNTVIRTDVFTFGNGTITEVRTLSTGQKLTIVTNTSTLRTSVTYSET